MNFMLHWKIPLGFHTCESVSVCKINLSSFFQIEVYECIDSGILITDEDEYQDEGEVQVFGSSQIFVNILDV